MSGTAISEPALGDSGERRRIAASGLDENLFVEAGAGTGKTTQLVRRVVNLVLSGRCRLREVAAITFTEAAAAELRDRLRVAFERIAADDADATARARAMQALSDADQAAISTLHGFALRIVSEHPSAAGLPPRVRIADEVSSTLAFEDRWERFVDGLYARAELDELLLRADTLRIKLEPTYHRESTLTDVAAILGQSWDRLEPFARETAFSALPPVDFGDFDRAVHDLAAAHASCRVPSDTLACWIGDRLPALRTIVAVESTDEKLAALWQLKALRPGRRGTRDSWDDPEGARQVVAEVNLRRDAVVGAAVHAVLHRFLVLIGGELWRAAEDRRRSGMLEFHDLLVLARRTLRASRSTRASLAERFRYVLLDEFQDTDPLQIEIAVLIAGTVADEPGDWQSATVAPGRLFFVGDAKQSIYRFRRADIGLYLDARDTFGAGGSRVRLSTNFRTVEPILGWINTLFGELMAVEEPRRQPRYEPLRAHRDPSISDHRVMLLGGPMAGSASVVRQAEAEHVAGLIDEIRRHPEMWPVHRSGVWRPATLSDITILVPTRLSLPFLRAELDRAGIPYRLDTGTLVFDTQEVRDVVAALRAVDDPSDEASLVAALRSPLYGCSDADLYTWRAAGGQWSVTRMPAEELAEHPVGVAVAHLHGLWRERWWSGPADLVERILRERQAMLAAFGDERPLEVIRRLRFLIEQARAFETAGGGGTRAFCAWAELQASSSSRVHEPLSADTDVDGVRVMTVHGAKGLEFPITILSGMSTQPNGQRRGAAVIWDGDRAEIRVGAGLSTDNFDPRSEVEDEMSDSEWLRLLYVAATRAADHLIVSRYHSEKNRRSYAKLVHDQIGGRDELHRPPWSAQPTPDADSDASEMPGAEFSAADEDRDRWLDRRRHLLRAAATPRVTSATAIASTDAADRKVDDDGTTDDDHPAAATAWRRGRAGTAIGRAVHATLQSLDPAIAADDPLIDDVARREATREALETQAPTVGAMVRSALRSAALDLARRYPHHRELYVAADVDGTVVEGYVDLLIEAPDGLVIVDYKTDTVRSEDDVDAKLARYELQGAAYALAVEQATGHHVSACLFVFCRPGGAIERAVTDLDAARRRVRGALAALAPLAADGGATGVGSATAGR
jgi:ATP-dependent helicase/nuclease subunit A